MHLICIMSIMSEMCRIEQQVAAPCWVLEFSFKLKSCLVSFIYKMRGWRGIYDHPRGNLLSHGRFVSLITYSIFEMSPNDQHDVQCELDRLSSSSEVGASNISRCVFAQLNTHTRVYDVNAFILSFARELGFVQVLVAWENPLSKPCQGSVSISAKICGYWSLTCTLRLTLF